jgi:hypothetical protein
LILPDADDPVPVQRNEGRAGSLVDNKIEYGKQKLL